METSYLLRKEVFPIDVLDIVELSSDLKLMIMYYNWIQNHIIEKW